MSLLVDIKFRKLLAFFIHMSFSIPSLSYLSKTIVACLILSYYWDNTLLTTLTDNPWIKTFFMPDLWWTIPGPMWAPVTILFSQWFFSWSPVGSPHVRGDQHSAEDWRASSSDLEAPPPCLSPGIPLSSLILYPMTLVPVASPDCTQSRKLPAVHSTQDLSLGSKLRQSFEQSGQLMSL